METPIPAGNVLLGPRALGGVREVGARVTGMEGMEGSVGGRGGAWCGERGQSRARSTNGEVREELTGSYRN